MGLFQWITIFTFAYFHSFYFRDRVSLRSSGWYERCRLLDWAQNSSKSACICVQVRPSLAYLFVCMDLGMDWSEDSESSDGTQVIRSAESSCLLKTPHREIGNLIMHYSSVRIRIRSNLKCSYKPLELPQMLLVVLLLLPTVQQHPRVQSAGQ